MNTIIVLPTYNEKDNLEVLVREILNIVPDTKILIADDNSPDGTGKIADRLAKENPGVEVLHRGEKLGLGKTYIAAFKEVSKMDVDYVIQMDCDFSHDPKYIPQFLKEIQTCDLVIGSRYLDHSHSQKYVSLLSRAASCYASWILQLKITDCLGGFKCFQKAILDQIDLDSFVSSGFVFQAEFNRRVLKKGSAVKEIPIYFLERKSGNTKKSIAVILEAFFMIPLLRLSRF